MLGVRLGEGECGARNDEKFALLCSAVWVLPGDERAEMLQENGGRGEGRASTPRRSRNDLLQLAVGQA